MKRKQLIFYAQRCSLFSPKTVQLPFLFGGSEIRYHLLERSPMLLGCPDVLPPIPSGETMGMGLGVLA